MSHDWPLVRLGDVLTLQRRWLVPELDRQYMEIGVRSFGRGIFHKAPVTGAELGNKRVLRIEPGDLILMNVFAWEGAVAVASEAEAGMIGSHRYATYTADRERCIPEFLNLYFKTEPGLDLLRRVSPGSAGRNRTLNLAQFIQQAVPLPPLEEQRRIVAVVELIAGKIERAHSLRQQSREEASALLNAGRRRLIGDGPAADWIRLGQLVERLEVGKSPACEPRPAVNQEWGVLKVGAVSFGVYDGRENKALPAGLTVNGSHEVKPGDFLMSRANTGALVGACAIVGRTRTKLLLSDKIFRFRFRPDAPTYLPWLDHVLKSPALRTQIEAAATGTSSTMKNISQEKVLGLLIPSASDTDQRRVAENLSRLGERMSSLKQQQGKTAVEIQSLMPALLHRLISGDA